MTKVQALRLVARWVRHAGPDGAAIRADWAKLVARLQVKTVCPACGGEQRATFHGMVCQAGHGYGFFG